MYVSLDHPVCIFNITDELTTEFKGKEYRKNLLSIFIFEDVTTTLLVNNKEVCINGSSICFLTHNQPLIVGSGLQGKCKLIQFNADVFCIQKHDAEVGCNGVLFNNMHEPPVLSIRKEHINLFEGIMQQMKDEVAENATCCVDMLESYMKQFLIQAVRIKKAEGSIIHEQHHTEHDKLAALKELIDKHYKEQRKLSFYADELCISESGLHKLVHKHFNKSLTNVLYEKLLMDAKSQLFQTNDAIKEICYDLGFSAPAYFTRFFKKHSGITPEVYRQTIRNSTNTV